MRFVFAAFIFFATLSAASARELDYRVAPEFVAGELKSLLVTFSFRGEGDGETVLRLPDAWGGKERLYRGISDLSVTGGDARIEPGDSPALHVIVHAPRAKLTVSYRLQQITPGPAKGGDGNLYEPLIQPAYLHLIGYTAWISPSFSDDEPLDFSFALDGFPAGWKVASSFAPDGLPFRGRLRFGDFKQSILIAGDFRVARYDAEGGPVTIAVHGTWPFTDEEFAHAVTKRVGTARKLFNSRDEPPFLITLLDLASDSGRFSLGGTGLTNAFAAFATRGSPLETFDHLLTHEYLHHWVPMQLAFMPDEHEESFYWFSEGFTDYLTWVTQLKGGTISYAHLVSKVDDTLDENDDSRLRTAPNDKVASSFWSDPFAQAMPYVRGRLFALHLDTLLREATSGRVQLIDVLLAMRDRFAAHPNDEAPPDYALVAAVRHVAGIDIRDEIDRFIEDGEAIEPQAAWLGPCAEPFVGPYMESDYGFDFNGSAKEKIVRGIRPGGPAALAGLADGQKIVGMEVASANNRAIGKVRVAVMVGASRREIAYDAVRPTDRLVTRFRLMAGLSEAELAQCASHWRG